MLKRIHAVLLSRHNNVTMETYCEACFQVNENLLAAIISTFSHTYLIFVEKMKFKICLLELYENFCPRYTFEVVED